MIPYDDLVVALATWRAKQGLPVAQLSGQLTPPPMVAAPAPKPVARTITPTRGVPPAPPKFVAVATPPPLAAPEAHEEVEAALLVEETHYDNEGDDFAMAFQSIQQVDHDDSSTSIGAPPAARDSFGGATQPEPEPDHPADGPGPKRPRNEDW